MRVAFSPQQIARQVCIGVQVRFAQTPLAWWTTLRQRHAHYENVIPTHGLSPRSERATLVAVPALPNHPRKSCQVRRFLLCLDDIWPLQRLSARQKLADRKIGRIRNDPYSP